MKKKKNNEINIKTIWKFFRSEKGKRYSFVVFYFFFFIFLFIFLSLDFTPVKSTKKKDIEVVKEEIQESSLPFVTSQLENKNYDFLYTINCQDKEIYKGKRRENMITLEKDEEQYSYKVQNGKLVGISKEIPYSIFLDIFSVKQMIKNSKLVSETKLTENLNYLYNYEIKNKELDEFLLQGNITDNINEIIIKTNSKKEIESIHVDLVNYIEDGKLCNVELKVEEVYE